VKEIAIFGAGGFGKEVLTLVQDLIRTEKERWKFIGFFDDLDYSNQLGKQYLGNQLVLNQWKDPIYLVIALGWSHIRSSVVSRIQNPLIEYPILISPRCILGDADRIKIGEGTIIMAGANLTTDITLGSFNVVNINATIGHDVGLGNFCSIMPSANISGSVKMDDEVFVGSGVTVLQNLNIGSKSVIGAGAVVTKDVPAGSTVVGIPARIIKKN